MGIYQPKWGRRWRIWVGGGSRFGLAGGIAGKAGGPWHWRGVHSGRVTRQALQSHALYIMIRNSIGAAMGAALWLAGINKIKNAE